MSDFTVQLITGTSKDALPVKSDALRYMGYKKNIPDQAQIINELTQCAEAIAVTDSKMLEIRKKIEFMSDAPTEDDILIEKISRLDFNIE